VVAEKTNDMDERRDVIIERVRIREVTGVFRLRNGLDAAIAALLVNGFDRADIDVMGGVEEIRRRLSDGEIAAEALADVPDLPRHPFIAFEDVSAAAITVTSILVCVGATAALWSAVGSAASSTLATIDAVAGAAIGGIIGWSIVRFLSTKYTQDLDARAAASGFIVWVRVRSLEREGKAQKILTENGGSAIRVHETEVARRLEDLPLLQPDPWLDKQPLGRS
jgi:hypothetical protein